MTRRDDAIEKAAEAIRANQWVKFTASDGHTSVALNDDEGIARAAVAAYEAVMRPEVTSVEELDALPVGTAFLDRYGELTQVGESVGPDGRERRYRRVLRPDAMPSAVPLPARVLHWGQP